MVQKSIHTTDLWVDSDIDPQTSLPVPSLIKTAIAFSIKNAKNYICASCAIVHVARGQKYNSRVFVEG